MNKRQRDELVRRMEEAVLLPPEDPGRQRLYAEIREVGDWARDYWLELVRQDERMRLELLDVEPPAGLGDRLRALVDGSAGAAVGPATAREQRTLLSRRGWLGLAASFAAAASVGSLTWLRNDNRSLDAAFQALGDAVHAHHAVAHPVEFASAAPADVEKRFADAFRWQVRMPTMGPAYALIGATTCELVGESVLCTQWQDTDGRRYSVFQFCAPDHGLPSEFDRRVVEAAIGNKVTFWTEGHCAYVMTADRDPAERPSA